jgi:hypothetical protein
MVLLVFLSLCKTTYANKKGLTSSLARNWFSTCYLDFQAISHYSFDSSIILGGGIAYIFFKCILKLLTFSEKTIVVLIKWSLVYLKTTSLGTWNSLPSFIWNNFNHNRAGLPLYNFCLFCCICLNPSLIPTLFFFIKV